jgi:hypothetical protein
MLIGEENTVGIAVEGNAERRLVLDHLLRDDLGMQRAAAEVDVAPIRSGMGDEHGATEVREELRGHGAGRAVGAIDDEPLIVQRQAWHGGQQEARVLGAVSLVDGRGGVVRCLLSVVRCVGELGEDLPLDRQLGCVGQLVAIGAEELDAVVLPGIVRGRDDHARGEAMRVGEVRDRRRGDDPGVLDRSSAGCEARGQARRNPVGGLAGVHAEEDVGLRGACLQGVRQGKPDGVDGCRVQRGLARDGANAVGAEELLHCVDFSVSD